MNKIKLTAFTMIAYVFIGQSILFAQSDKSLSDTDIDKYCQEIMEAFVQNNEMLAFGRVKQIANFDITENSYLEHWKAYKTHFGKPVSYKMVKEKSIEDVLYRRIYVLKYEEYGVLLTFTFYQGKADKWYFTGLTWSDKLTTLFD